MNLETSAVSDSAELSQTSPSQSHGATQTVSADPQSQNMLSENAKVQASTQNSGPIETPQKPMNNDEESPFCTHPVPTPTLHLRRNSEPFTLHLGPDAARNEANLHKAINETVRDKQRVQPSMRLSLTPGEAATVRDRQAAQVLSQFTDESLTLRDALWYLEHADWDMELAILKQIKDEINRTEAPAPDLFADENQHLDRDPVRGGDAFNPAKFSVHYNRYGVARSKIYPAWQAFDCKNFHHVRALNRWRWKLIVAQVGLPKLSKRKRWGYSKLELAWVEKYERQNPDSTGRTTKDAFNASFAGQMLLGETEPRPERSTTAIACLRLRKGASGVRKRKMDEAALDEGGKEDRGGNGGDVDGGTEEVEVEGQGKKEGEEGGKEAGHKDGD